MTLQELLLQSPKKSSTSRISKQVETEEMISAKKREQAAQTAKLIAANKAAAAALLKVAMQKIESNSASYREVERKIWI